MIGFAPRVSVLIPFLDPEPRFLDEAVESVLSQTFRDWEILLVNDGSAPPASGVADAWARAYPRQIRLLEHPGGGNRGTPVSRNLGIEHARGDLLAFLDADDVWLPERLERHVELLDALPEVGMVYGPSLYWHSWAEGSKGSGDHVPPLGVPDRRALSPPGPLALFVAGGGAVPCPCSVTIRTALLREVGGGEPSLPVTYEDQVLWAKLALRTSVCAEDRVLDRYRQHGASVTARSGPEAQRRSRRRFLEWLDRHLDEEGMAVPEVRRAIRSELWALDHPFRARVRRFLRKQRRRLAAAAPGPAPGGEEDTP
jgi:glycosyltransferase involved in cell wall biosynthesis